MNWRWEGGDAHEIFNAKPEDFVSIALSLYRWQATNNKVFNDFLRLRRVDASNVQTLRQIVPLPIGFFKTHKVVTGSFNAEAVFSSSGTTGAERSSHYVRSLGFYHLAALNAYQFAFARSAAETDFYFLLPGYMERNGSSLIEMAEQFRRINNAGRGGFFLNATAKMMHAISDSLSCGRSSVLFGVTFALLDLATHLPGGLPEGVQVLETGGMKGRREEITRRELHQTLCKAFGVSRILSEYGMTELLSQAYSLENGVFMPPPWMKVLVRSEDDPMMLCCDGTGLLVIIDLANQASCAFLETQDVGRVYTDGSFEILGRLDSSDLRGCSLLTA